MERTTLYVPEELRRRLADEARRQGRPQAELVREALVRYLDRQRPERPRLVGVASRTGVSARVAKRAVRSAWERDAARGRRKPTRRIARTRG
jgi:predicted transcriptional regulator